MVYKTMASNHLKINEWWVNQPDEKYWMEITRRPDIGADLKAPQFAEDGQSQTYSYTLTKYVKDGDVIFHYYKNKKAIIGFSIVDGTYYDDDIIWKALGSSAAKSDIKPYPRPGWKVGLKNFQSFESPITLERLRLNSKNILKIKNHLESKIKGGLYFPFSFIKKDNSLNGAVQGYLVKFPQLLTFEFPELKNSTSLTETKINPIISENLGTSYRIADESVAISKREPFELDPDVLDRGTKAHRKIQNNLASILENNNITPESPNNPRINFDIGWRSGEKYFIAEIKSITNKNEEKQLRLGLGQILRYFSLIEKQNISEIVPLLIVEKLSDESWYQTCEKQNVKLLVPENFESILNY